MAYEITESDESPIIVIRFIGSVDDEEILAMLDELTRADGYSFKHQLIDFSGVEDFLITNAGLIRYVSAAEAQPDRFRAMENRRAALYTPDDLSFASAKLVVAYANEWTENIKGFRVKDEAIAWLMGNDT